MAGTSKATHTACCLGMVQKAFVRAGNTDSACYYRYTAGMLGYRANQMAE